LDNNKNETLKSYYYFYFYQAYLFRFIIIRNCSTLVQYFSMIQKVWINVIGG